MISVADSYKNPAADLHLACSVSEFEHTGNETFCLSIQRGSRNAIKLMNIICGFSSKRMNPSLYSQRSMLQSWLSDEEISPKIELVEHFLIGPRDKELMSVLSKNCYYGGNKRNRLCFSQRLRSIQF